MGILSNQFFIDFARAKMKGWTVEILSDQLTVRGYSSSDAWAPGPMVVQPIVAQPPSLPNLEAALSSIVSRDTTGVADLNFTLTFFFPTQPEPQRAQVARLCRQTGLNVKYAVDCLQQNGWDHERAVANFEQVKVRKNCFRASAECIRCGNFGIPRGLDAEYDVDRADVTLQGSLSRDAFL